MREGEAIRQAARTHAIDWYLAALLAPRPARDDLITLAAFAGEVERIPLTVSEPALAAVRLQWWWEAIENGAGGALSGNPVADTLTDVARRRNFPADLLTLPLAGRERELESNAIADGAEFEDYLDETWGTAFRLAARTLAGNDTAAPDTLYRRAAAAYGRMRLALDLPRYLARGLLPLPASLLQEGDPRMLPETEARAAARQLVASLCDEAREALAASRAALESAPAAMRPAFLPLALVEPYLRALEKPDHDPLREIADISPLTRVARLWLANMRGRV